MQLLLTLDTLPPSQVLAERLNLVGRHVIPYVLVQRESCPTHWATWNQLQPYQSSYPGRCPRRLLHREDALQLKEEGLSRNGPYAMHSDWATLANGPVSRLVCRMGVIPGLGPISFCTLLKLAVWAVGQTAIK